MIEIQMRWLRINFGVGLALAFLVVAQCAYAASVDRYDPPTIKDWTDISSLPDWSGSWNPKITDQDMQQKTNPPPWNARAAATIKFQYAEEAAGRPTPLFVNCLPEGMPSWMLITHNAMEILFTPGRVTMLGESDGNRIRRIYTDGRKHPDDPDPTLHGHSIGHWEGDTLVVDTVGIIPQSLLAVSEAAGVPSNGDMHVVERIHLQGKDILADDLEIFAPKVLTKPWKTTRLFFRQRAKKYDIVEGICLEGTYIPKIDKNGDAVYEQIQYDVGGNRTVTNK
jgi:hypothetical protein